MAFGPDGSLYVGDALNWRVRRIAPDGIVTTFAGGGSQSGEGVPATSVSLGSPSGVAVGPDGSVYFSETFGEFSTVVGDKVRKVSPDGLITTVAGVPRNQDGGDGGPARGAYLAEPRALAVGSDGALFIGERGGSFGNPPSRVRRVGTDGIITTYAGGGTSTADGIAATDAAIWPRGLAFGADGLYIAADHRVRLVSSDGIVTTLAGTGQPGFAGDGGPAAAALIGNPVGIALAPDGDIFVDEYSNYRVRRVTRQLPTIGDGDLLVPSGDGSQLYHFDPTGRHVRTVDALTGAVQHQFTYDGAGRLSTVTDIDGNVTTIERAPEGNPTAIVAPGGQRTTLEVNGDGYLIRAANPANETVSLTYEPGGLLASFTEPRGGVHHFTYDALGRLVADEDPAGGTKTLTRTELVDGHAVRLRSPSGLESTYESHRTWYGFEHDTTDPAGGRTVNRIYTSSGTQQIERSDGTVVEITVAPIPASACTHLAPPRSRYAPPGGSSSSSSPPVPSLWPTPRDPQPAGAD